MAFEQPVTFLCSFEFPKSKVKYLKNYIISGVTGDFWIGASKLGDTKFNFIPDFLPVSKVHTETIDGVSASTLKRPVVIKPCLGSQDGDCVFLRVDSQFKVKWAAGECGYTNEKYIICETNP